MTGDRPTYFLLLNDRQSVYLFSASEWQAIGLLILRSLLFNNKSLFNDCVQATYLLNLANWAIH